MRTLIIICIAAQAVFALSNKVTLIDTSGSGQGTRTWIIPRYFAENEICDNPKPYVSGVAASYWQAHVETRWPASTTCPSGAAKIAVIAVEATVGDVDFRDTTDYCHLGDSSTCAAAGASKTDLLNFDAGGGAASWGAKITATTGAISMSRSARTMITNDHYQILRNGPLYVEVVVREGPEAVSAATTRTTNFGWQCTATCTSPYASATWADNSTYYSIRPTFYLRFYRRWGKVEGDFVAHSGWNDRFVDQRIESFTIYTGGAETTSSVTLSTPFVMGPGQTWYEGPFWNGGAPNASNINFNPQYLMMSKLIPTQDLDRLTIGSTAAAYHQTAWAASDQGATTTASITPSMGQGRFNKTMATAGGNIYTGPFTSWTAQWLVSQNVNLRDEILGEARAGLHWFWAYLEGATSGTWATGEAASPFGRPITIERRTDWFSGLGDRSTISSFVGTANRPKSPAGNDILTTCTDPSCYVGCSTKTGTLSVHWCTSVSNTYPNDFNADRAHHPEMFFIPYLITGKPMWREALYHQAAWQVASAQSIVNSNQQTPRWYESGFIYDVNNLIRVVAWPLRTLGHAALLAPDGSSEKVYFTRMLNNNVELHEGRLGITDGSYPPTSTTAPYDCVYTSVASYYNTTPSTPGTISKWCFGRYYMDRGLTNTMRYPGRMNLPNASPVSYGFGVDLRYGSSHYPLWMSGYWAYVLGHLRDLGFTQVTKLQESASTFFLKVFGDSGCNRDFSCSSFYNPLYNASGSDMLQTPAEMKAAIIRGAPLSRPINSSDTTIRVASMRQNNTGPIWDTSYTSTGGVISIGSEMIMLNTSNATSTAISGGTISAATDQITFGSAHGYTDGWLIEFQATATGSAVTLPIAADFTNCIMPSGKGHCRWYVKVISSTVLECYTNSALTNKVDFTADQSSIWAGYVSFGVESGTPNRCGYTPCRGYLGTTAASHNPGEAVAATGSQPSWSQWLNDVGWAYGHIIRSALAYAVNYPVTVTDTSEGTRISPTRTYNRFAGNIYLQDQYGEYSGCSSLSNCGANRWAWVPYRGPSNVRVQTSGGNLTLRWVAPTGRNCKVSVASPTYSNTDDSSDFNDTANHLSRSYTFSGLTVGASYQYRITCSTGRVLGTVTIQ